MKSILSFKKNDVITRVIPSKTGDRSYMGDKLLFVGVANAQIYYKNMSAIFDADKIRNVHFDQWQDGWVDYIDPEKLFNSNETFVIVDTRTESDKISEDLAKAFANLSESFNLNLDFLTIRK